jgi:anthranilate synthase component 2
MALLNQMSGLTVSLFKNDQLWKIDVNQFDKLIVSPGPNLPSCAGDLMPFLQKNLTTLPTLGICLGHQAIAECFGGSLVQYDIPQHGEKTKLIIHKPNTLFEGLPSSFEVGLYHSWYVDQKKFPEDLRITATNKSDIIMAMEHKSLPIYSVQFHPESFMSEYGLEIMKNFIEHPNR